MMFVIHAIIGSILEYVLLSGKLSKFVNEGIVVVSTIAGINLGIIAITWTIYGCFIWILLFPDTLT